MSNIVIFSQNKAGQNSGIWPYNLGLMTKALLVSKAKDQRWLSFFKFSTPSVAEYTADIQCRIPEVDPMFEPHEGLDRMYARLSGMQPDTAMWLYGPLGTGKSTLVRQFCAVSRLPLFEVTGDGSPDFLRDCLGSRTMTNGSIEHIDGPLTLAWRFGGVFLVDEFDQLEPSVGKSMNTLLDGTKSLVLDSGEVVLRNPMFRFVVTANTRGVGEDSIYASSRSMDPAMLSRFIKYEVSYLPREVEIQVINSRTDDALPALLVESLVDFANKCRQGHSLPEMDENHLSMPLSTRTLIKWCDLLAHEWFDAEKDGFILRGFDATFGAMLQTGEQVALREELKNIFPGGRFILSEVMRASQEREAAHA